MKTVLPRNIKSRFKLLFAFLLAVPILCFFHWYDSSNRKSLELDFFKANQKFLDTVNATECILPTYDLYDPSILQFVKKHPAPINCEQLQPYLTYMDWDGNLYLNQTELAINKYKALTCRYETVIGDKMDDYKVSYENQIEINIFPVAIKENVIRVKCMEVLKLIYIMIHSQIRPLKQEVIDRNKKIPAHRPSVLIFTVDSMSRGNFIRTLPKTYRYLKDKQNINVFKGLNKVADNTFPNMMALLAGFIGYQRSDMPHVPKWTIKMNSTMKRYDDMPIIWKTFQNSGYVTMYAEEYLDATFSLLDVGFYDDPVDYYYRSTYVSLKKSLSHWDKMRKKDYTQRRYCVANEPSYKHVLNYTEEFLTEMADYRYFAFSFFVEMSHDVLTDVKNMDVNLFNFFVRMFESGFFKNTIVIVMGDHGHRFDKIRSTIIGRIEERMPFLGIIVPESLDKLHPHVQKSFKSHSERLLSWYDIHETLVDFALDDISEKAVNLRPNAIGKSIIRPFDDNRTCTEIGILPEYCMCDREAQIPTTSKKALESARIIIEHINNLLKYSDKYIRDGDNRRCARLILEKITSASVSMRSITSGPSSLLVRVAIEVLPSNGLFEAAVEYKPTSTNLLGDINRINRYGNQSSCISHDIMRLYCYCIS